MLAVLPVGHDFIDFAWVFIAKAGGSVILSWQEEEVEPKVLMAIVPTLRTVCIIPAR